MNCEELKASVLQWFGEEIECRQSGADALIAILPLLKPNGDPIEIGLELIGKERWRMSDLGDTHSTLFLAGVDLNEEYVRAEEFRQIVAAHSISDRQQELSIESSTGELASRLFDFVHGVQSMLALQLTVKPKQESRDFASVVAKFLAENRASFEIPARTIEGKSGSWRFNFVLNHVRPEETLVKALSVTTTNGAFVLAKQAVFEILDVKEVRNFDAVIVADDEGARDEVWTQPVLRLFEEWGIRAFPFTERRQDLRELAQRYAY